MILKWLLNLQCLTPLLLQVIIGVQQVPSLVVFIPDQEQDRSDWIVSLQRPGSLVGTMLNKRVNLHFVCLLSLEICKEGFPLTLTKDWVKRAAPYFKVDAILIPRLPRRLPPLAAS